MSYWEKGARERALFCFKFREGIDNECQTFIKWRRHVFARYLMPYLQKKGVRQYIENEINEAVDVEDFVRKYIFGIKSLNESEIELDKEFAQYIIKKSEEQSKQIIEKDVKDWSEDDYHFIRGTIDFEKNPAKQRKVLEYLNHYKEVE